VPLALDFITNSETALRHLVDYCRAQPVDAIVALDDKRYTPGNPRRRRRVGACRTIR